MRVAFALLFICVTAFALQREYRLDTAVTALTATFPATPQLKGFTQITAIQVANNSNAEIEVNCSSGTTVPAPDSGTGFHVAAGQTMSSPSYISVTGTCFIRAETGTASTGVIELIGWGW